MGKKIFLFVAAILVLNTISFSQTASATIGNVDPSSYYVGEEIYVPINVTNFNNIGAITLFIGYDPNVVTFIATVNINSQVSGILSNAYNSQVLMAWSANPPNWATISSGILCKMKFVYLGGSCNITFNPGCEVVNSSLNPINVTYTNNQIPVNNAGANTVKLIDVNNAIVGNTVNVAVEINGLTNVGAITFTINYDNAKLSYINVTNGSISGVVVNPSGGTLYVTWTSLIGVTFSNSTAFTLNFTYNGIGAADLSFGPGCVITSTSDVNLPASYFNGSVNPANYSYNVTLSSDQAFFGQPISETITFDGFPSNVGAVTLLIAYDTEMITYTGGYGTGNLTGIAVSTNNGVITIAWSDYLGKNINSSLIVLNLEYNGGGTTELEFTTGTEIRTNTNTLLNANYINSVISQNTSTQIADIGSITTCAGNEAIVPVTFNGFYQTAASLTLKIGYDVTKLNYLSVTATAGLSGITASTSTNPDRVNVTWSNPAGIDINTCVIYLHFLYQGGGMTDLTFDPGTYMTNLIDVINATYYDGTVSQTSISGYITYDNAVSTPLDNLTVNLMLGPTVISTTYTDADGFYQFPVCENGNYSIEVTTTKPYCGNNGSDIVDALAAYDHSILFVIITDPMKLIAADVNEDTSIDIFDVLMIYDRSIGFLNPAWTLPDWVFEDVSVNMVGSSVVQNIKGICAGDVDGSYVP